MERLSKNFTLRELTNTSISPNMAARNFIAGSRDYIFKNLKRVANDLLEPLREVYGVPLIIPSGYRCEELNKAVGGSEFSAHLRGEAVDYCPRGYSHRLKDALVLAMDWGLSDPAKPKFRQLLIERGCLHISLPFGVAGDGEVAEYDVPTKTKRIIRKGIS